MKRTISNGPMGLRNKSQNNFYEHSIKRENEIYQKQKWVREKRLFFIFLFLTPTLSHSQKLKLTFGFNEIA